MGPAHSQKETMIFGTDVCVSACVFVHVHVCVCATADALCGDFIMHTTTQACTSNCPCMHASP